VVIKDFAVDQNPLGHPVPLTNDGPHVIDIPTSVGGVNGITVSGMSFDPTGAMHTIHLESTGDLRATITNNYFNFGTMYPNTPYTNAGVFLEGAQQVVTGNTFFASAIGQSAGTAIETHGGRSTISNNTANNYASMVNILPTSQAVGFTVVSPNNVVVANNSVTCAQAGIAMTGLGSPRTIQNLSITGNTIHVCNSARTTTTPNDIIFAGIRYNSATGGDVDSVDISNNIISMEGQTVTYTDNASLGTGGIQLYTMTNLSNAVISGNIITNSPVSGIRVGSASTATVPRPVQRVRIIENTIVDAGRDGAIGNTNINRHAISLSGIASDIDVMRNMIYDTGSGAANGLYSFYLNPTLTSSANIRTSQNTVRGAALHGFQNANAGIVDATNGNDVFITSIRGGTPTSAVPLNVDFMSFTRYIMTINDGQTGFAATVNVLNPLPDSSSVQWTVGQLVTFRFICQFASGCLVTFDDQATPANSIYSTTGAFNVPSGTGRAITFEVENFSPGPGHRFFELYRTPAGVAN